MKIQCLIVDDEPLARELLVSYLERVDCLELVGQCKNALEAFAFLQNRSVDLMFLDIQMPKMNGLELIKSLHNRPRIIISTAFREYAVEGFDLDVLDYLVKPVSFDRFLKAVAKYTHYEAKAKSPENSKDDFEEAYMFVKVNKDMIRVMLKDICYIESIRDYLKIVLKDRHFITYQRISYMEEKLPEGKFMRIHKSYIVALEKIVSYRNDTIYLEKFDLPIGRSFRQNFLKQLAAVGMVNGK